MSFMCPKHEYYLLLPTSLPCASKLAGRVARAVNLQNALLDDHVILFANIVVFIHLLCSLSLGFVSQEQALGTLLRPPLPLLLVELLPSSSLLLTRWATVAELAVHALTAASCMHKHARLALA
jgi:hypothetical protein